MNWERLENEAAAAVREVIRRFRPEEPRKTVHLVLVTYNNGPVWPDYWTALSSVPRWVDEWLAPQGLAVSNWAVHHAAVPESPGSYSRGTLVVQLQEQSLCFFDGESAWYLFSQDPTGELDGFYGTLGGDVFGQAEGQEGNRVPGLSMFNVQGLHALAYSKTHPTSNAGEIWPRNKALGCIVHELGHNLGVLPCAGCDLHDSRKCVMTSRLYSFPDCEFETGGGLFGCKPGNERRALEGYAFVQRL